MCRGGSLLKCNTKYLSLGEHQASYFSHCTHCSSKHDCCDSWKKHSKIVVINVGIFRLSIAQKLASEGHKNVLVSDRHMPPVEMILELCPNIRTKHLRFPMAAAHIYLESSTLTMLIKTTSSYPRNRNLLEPHETNLVVARLGDRSLFQRVCSWFIITINLCLPDASQLVGLLYSHDMEKKLFSSNLMFVDRSGRNVLECIYIELLFARIRLDIVIVLLL